MTIGAFLVARLSSARLPEKSIKKILDRPMMELMVERVRQTKFIDKIIIATSDLPSDDPLEELSRKLDIGCYRGPLEDINGRIVSAASTFECDTIVELLGDNPLVHSDVIGQVINLFKNDNLDYAANITKEYPISEDGFALFSLGVRVQVYKASVAARYKEFLFYSKSEDRGSTAYIFEHPSLFKIGYLEAKNEFSCMNRPLLNFAVNYKRNFDAVRTIFEKCHPQNQNFSLKDVFKLLDEERYLYSMLG
jgi:spore coat polysaccharide biosynthesis protein SpsF (cytidylyltransferase family)